MIRIDDIEQNTPAWLALKAGVPSASNFDKIIQMSGKASTQRKKYLYQLAGERITGIREDGYQNDAMRRGIEMEPEAVSAYELIFDVETEKVGVCYMDEKKSFLCSPDRIIVGNPWGLLEVKCPAIQTHVGYLVDDKLPSEYFQQVQGQMYVAGADWVDFMSYYPSMKPLLVRVNRDKEFIAKLESELKTFCSDLEEVVLRIR